LLTLISNFSRSHLLLSPRHKKNKHQTVFGLADAETVERRKKEKEKFYERTEVVMGKCLLHKETDASKVDPEVRAFVGMRSVFYFVIFLKAIMTDTIQIDR
jgi:hypothetical protein